MKSLPGVPTRWHLSGTKTPTGWKLPILLNCLESIPWAWSISSSESHLPLSITWRKSATFFLQLAGLAGIGPAFLVPFF